jgi:hypothetical protein
MFLSAADVASTKVACWHDGGIWALLTPKAARTTRTAENTAHIFILFIPHLLEMYSDHCIIHRQGRKRGLSGGR